jgi:hypothetical protein
MPKTDDVLILGVPTVRDANNIKGGCDTGTGWLVGPTSRTSRTSIIPLVLAKIHAGCKIWHRFYTITGLSSQQRVALVDTARLKRPLLIKVDITL